jgi:hypothetical protein
VPAVHAKDEGRKVAGLAAWREFWNTDETGSTETPELSFAWDSARLLPTPEAIAWLHGIVDLAKQNEANDLPELGPDWETIGPGDAYVRALAARGQPVSAEKLRPEAPDEGPFVLLREGQPIGGHATLQEAINAALSGDEIEIRTDEPFAGGNTSLHEHGRKLTIRSAPGYLPVLEGRFVYESTGDLTLEGVHFRDGPVDTRYNGTGALRLVNCSFGAPAARGTVEGVALDDKDRAAEMINCWAPGPILQSLGPASLSSIRNSVVGRILATSFGGGERHLAIESAVLWNPGHEFEPAFLTPGDGRLNVALDNTLVESAHLLASLPPVLQEVGWKNARNLYRTGYSNLVERLRTECASGDEGSITSAPFDFDPLQWRLLPGSAGFQASADGSDYGADVTRIAVTK